MNASTFPDAYPAAICVTDRLIRDRRGMIDMRKRFRGNAPISLAKDVESTSAKKPSSPGQLYAGKPAFETVKEISGDEVQMDPEKTRGL